MATNSDSTTNLESELSTGLSLSDNDLNDLIKIQGDLVRKLKAEKSSPEQVSNYIINLIDIMKKQLF